VRPFVLRRTVQIRRLLCIPRFHRSSAFTPPASSPVSSATRPSRFSTTNPLGEALGTDFGAAFATARDLANFSPNISRRTAPLLFTNCDKRLHEMFCNFSQDWQVVRARQMKNRKILILHCFSNNLIFRQTFLRIIDDAKQNFTLFTDDDTMFCYTFSATSAVRLRSLFLPPANISQPR